MINKYWKEFLFFSIIAIYYLIGVAPDMTWMSQGGDAFDYVVGSKNFWAVRPTGYPTYIMIGWLFERLPGNDFWKLGLLSALASGITCVFIYLSVRHFTTNKVAPYVGALTYAGSFLVWTQSVIPEVYTLTTMLMVIATYFILKGKWLPSAIALAFGVGVHHLIVFAVFPLLVYLWLGNRKWKSVGSYIGVMCIGFLAYLQTIFYVVGQETTSGAGTIGSQTLGSLGFVFGLPIWETWGRLKEAVPILLTGLGVGIVLFAYLRKTKDTILLGVLAILPFSYYFFSNIPMWVVYAVPAFAFGSILIGTGVGNFPYRKILPAFVVVPVLFMGINLGTYDIGRTVDRSPTGARQFYTKLDEIPDNAVFYLSKLGEPWLETYYYTVENNNRFWFLFEGELRFHPNDYSHYKVSQGLVMPTDFSRYGQIDEYGMYYITWDEDLFLKDFMGLNPDKEVWVVSVRKGGTFEDLAFDFGSYSPTGR